MEKFPFLAAPLPVPPAVVVPRLLFSCCSSSGMPRAPQPPQLGSAPSTQPCPAGMGQSQAGRAAVGLSRAPSPWSPHWQRCWHRGTRPVWVRGTSGTDVPTPVPAWPSPPRAGYRQQTLGKGWEVLGEHRPQHKPRLPLPAGSPAALQMAPWPRSCGWAPHTAPLLLPAAARAGTKPARGLGEQNRCLGSGRRELKAN